MQDLEEEEERERVEREREGGERERVEREEREREELEEMERQRQRETEDEEGSQEGPSEEEEEDLEDPATATVEDLQIALQFIEGVKHAELEDCKLDPEVLDRLRNPIQAPLVVEDRDTLFSMKLFSVTGRASQAVYNEVREAILERHPEDDILTYDQAKRAVRDNTGVVSILDDMCPGSCLAYTGPYRDLEECPKCGLGRYDPVILRQSKGKKKVPLRQFHTIPLGPILQALERSLEGSQNMEHFWKSMQEILNNVDPELGDLVLENYDDFDCGSDIIKAVQRGDIGKDDTLLMFSIDGAQLFKGKKSDCWIYIWVILNLSPDRRYKKHYVLPGGFIPGPNNPKDVDSFSYPGLHHVSALQREGLKVWKASTNVVVINRPFLVFVTADGVGMTGQSGLAGHMAALGCRRSCGVAGEAQTWWQKLLCSSSKARWVYC